MKLKVRGITVFQIMPFIGAGWSWPYCHFQKWKVGIYFHCKRGLYLGFGWDEVDRRLRNRILSLTLDERRQMLDALRVPNDPEN